MFFIAAVVFSFDAEAQGVPKMEVLGNNLVISNGSATPAAANNTDFGDVSVNGGVSKRRFVIRNIGTAPLKIRCGDPLGEEPEECEVHPAVWFTGDNLQNFSLGFQSILFQADGVSIPANGSATVVLHFLSSALGIRRATAGIFSNDPINGRFFFAVQGNAINIPLGPRPRPQVLGNGLVIDIRSLVCAPLISNHTNFGSGIASGIRSFTLRNIGDANLILDSVQVLAPVGNGLFTVLTQPASILAPNASTQFTVQYSGDFSSSFALLAIDNNSDAEDPISFCIAANL